jgi:hypothetical protein
MAVDIRQSRKQGIEVNLALVEVRRQKRGRGRLAMNERKQGQVNPQN